jgi:hypothetical protein
MYRVAYRNLGSHQSILANHTVETTGAGSPTGVRWYELQDTGSGFTVYQQATFSPDSDYRWAGSIAMDQAGDIALGYSVSSISMSPTIRYTGRVPTDSLGQMESENDILLAANPPINPGSLTTTFHWADYSSMSIDPTDDCTFWYTTEYVPATGSDWSTRIASFNFPSCGVTPDFSVTPSQLSQTVSPGSPATFTVSVAAIGAFNSAVSLTCSTPSAIGMACSFSPTSATPGNSVTLTITTTAPSAALASPPGTTRSHPLYAAWMGFPVLALVGIGSVGRRSRQRKLACLLFCAMLSGLVALQLGCSGSTSGGGQNGGTPAGTYTVNITATSGSTQHSSSVSVTVQ